MKIFFKKILWFFIPIILGSIALDYIISRKLKNTNDFAKGENSVWNDIYESKLQNFNGFVYGSSRAWVHIDPELLSRDLGIQFYNLGVDGHNFNLQLLRHQELVAYNGNPEIIIYSIDEFTLAKRKDLYNYQQFLPYMFWDEKIKSFTSNYEGFSIYDYYLPLIRYVGENKELNKVFFTRDIPYPIRNRGYQAIDEKWNQDFEIAKEKFEKFEIELDTTSIIKFEKFLKSTNKNKTKIIFVYTPEYIEGQNFISNREDIMGIFKNLSQKYNITFLDYSKGEISHQKKYFYNTLHLNTIGSKLFSKKLAKDIENTGILKGGI